MAIYCIHNRKRYISTQRTYPIHDERESGLFIHLPRDLVDRVDLREGVGETVRLAVYPDAFTLELQDDVEDLQ